MFSRSHVLTPNHVLMFSCLNKNPCSYILMSLKKHVPPFSCLKKTCKTTIRIVSLHNKSPFRDTEWPFRVTEWPFRVTEWSFRVTEQTFKYSYKEK